MLFCVLRSAPPNGCRDTQHPTWIIEKEKLISGDQVVGRQKPAHHQEYCSDTCGGCARLICVIFVVNKVMYMTAHGVHTSCKYTMYNEAAKRGNTANWGE